MRAQFPQEACATWTIYGFQSFQSPHRNKSDSGPLRTFTLVCDPGHGGVTETHIGITAHAFCSRIKTRAKITPDFKPETLRVEKLSEDHPHQQRDDCRFTSSTSGSYHNFRRPYRFQRQPCSKISNHKTFAGEGGSKFSRRVDFKFAGTWRLSRLLLVARVGWATLEFCGETLQIHQQSCVYVRFPRTYGSGV